MENVSYKELKMQSYFSSEQTTQNQKRTIFKYRTRMERFGENYRGGNGPAICPLCNLHLDNQEMSLQCPEIKKELNLSGNLSDIYKDDIKLEIIEIVTKISKFRKQKLEND